MSTDKTKEVNEKLEEWKRERERRERENEKRLKKSKNKNWKERENTRVLEWKNGKK